MIKMISINKTIKENLNKWDELTPLKEQQIKSVLFLNQLNQFQSNENDLIGAASNDPNMINDLKKNDDLDESKIKNVSFEINEDINELLYNFDVNDIEDARIEKYVSTLNKNFKKTTVVSESIEEALNNLNILLDNYSKVSQKTRSLHVACEQLLNDQVNIFSNFFFQKQQILNINLK
jgi:hypothetical protein